MTDYNRPLKKQISVTLDYDLVERLKELANEDDRALSPYINHILRKEIMQINSDKI